jgi:hypothetical protein
MPLLTTRFTEACSTAAALHAGKPLRSEIDLAYAWESARPGGP